MDDAKLVVVTGGAGYLGSVLVPLLVKSGFRVRVVDRFFFGPETVSGCGAELIEADTRHCPKEVFEGAYAVIDLAALSNDPAGELNVERTLEINYRARVRTATLAKEAGVERYVLASSCSVYGFQDGMVDESATPAPLTTYAESSLMAELGTQALNDETFTVTAFRQGTLYGLSPRMRFDIVVNIMTLSHHRDGYLTVRGGEQWRPLLHVADSASAFVNILKTSRETIAGETFNLGATEHNFTVADIAKQVLAGAGLEGRIVHDKTALDTRSYRVSFEKVKRVLGFVPKRTPQDGAREIMQALKNGTLMDGTKTRTIDWYKELLQENPAVLDAEFVDARTL